MNESFGVQLLYSEKMSDKLLREAVSVVSADLSKITFAPEKLIPHSLQNSWTFWFYKVCKLFSCSYQSLFLNFAEKYDAGMEEEPQGFVDSAYSGGILEFLPPPHPRQ